MDPILTGGLFSLASKVFDKFFPDPEERAKAQLQLLTMQQAGEFKEMDMQLQAAQMQADINRVEAASSSIFSSGWRPFIGWICGCGLAYQFLLRPLLTFVLLLVDARVTTLPALELDTLLTLLGGMLGLATLRTKEKLQGVSNALSNTK